MTMAFDCASLRTAEPAQVAKAISLLSSRGILLDEDSTFIGSPAIEKCVKTIEEIARENGYAGGELKTLSQYYGNHGAVYAVYDSEQFTSESALSYVDKHVANYDRLSGGDFYTPGSRENP